MYEIREDFGRNIVKEFPAESKGQRHNPVVPETGDDPAMGVHEDQVCAGNGLQDGTAT